MTLAMRRCLSLVVLIAGCAGTKVASIPVHSSPPSSTAAPPIASSAPPPPSVEEQALAHVPPAPAECSRYGERSSEPRTDCADRKAWLIALDSALATPDPMARDAALATLGGCSGMASGLVMALRAELAPAACGDVLLGDFAELNRSKLAPAIYDALIGLKLAAQLTRLVRVAPQVQRPHTKERIDLFVREVMGQWATEQANAISALSFKGARLSGYGKGVAALEAGLADMRFVDVFREVPLPEEFAKDPELTDAYYSALDQGLEPRKSRGRDAALVGLRVFSEVGVLKDARVEQARALLSRLYNGRRINALDSLLLPQIDQPALHDHEHRLAATLPTFYVDFVIGSVATSSTSLLWALFQRGIPASVLSRLERSVLSVDNQVLYTRALFERGRTYWRTPDFAAAVKIATIREPVTESGKLVAALARALEKGPQDAAAMMLGSTQLEELGDLKPLEVIAASKSPIAAFATYDAAIIKELGSAVNGNAAFFKDLAQRYERAATLLKEPALKELARDRAAAATETARKLH